MEHQRHGPLDPVLAGSQRFGGDVAGLSRPLVEPHDAAAIDQIRVQRIGRHKAVFVGAHPHPVAEGDLAAVAAAGDANGAAFLLAAIDPIGELLVGEDMIELRGGLVVPAAPRAAAVDADGGALIRRVDHDFRRLRVDPHPLIIIAAGRPLVRDPSLAAILRSIGGGVGEEDEIFVRRVHDDFAIAAVWPPDAPVGADQRPMRAAIVGAVDATVLHGVDHGIDAVRIAWCHANTGEAQALCCARQPAGELAPARTAVGRLVDAAVGA